MIGVAVKVTLVPAQIVLSASLEVMVTLAGKVVFTDVIIVSDTAGEPLAHARLEVN